MRAVDFRFDGEKHSLWHQFSVAFPDVSFSPSTASATTGDLFPKIIGQETAWNAGPADDFAGDTSTTGRIGLDGQFAAGTLDWNGDSDWFSFRAEAGELYSIDLLQRAGELQNYDIKVYDRFGNQLPEWMYTSGDHYEVYFATGGRYYVEFSSSDRLDSGQGEYVLGLTRRDEAGGTPGTAGVLPSDGSIVWGDTDFSGDADWYAFEVTAGQHFYVDLGGQFNSTLTLYDQNGLALASGSSGLDGNGQVQLEYDFTSGGTYYFGASADGPYSLQAIEDIASDGMDTTAQLPVNGVRQTVEISSETDVDWLRLDVAAGQTVWFHADNYSLEDLSVNLRGRAGGLLLQDAAVDGDFSYTFARAGTYFVDLSSTGRSNVFLRAWSEPADIADNISTTAELVLNGDTGSFFTSENYAQDHDWYRVTLQAGETLYVSLTADVGAVSMGMELYDSDGQAMPSYHANPRSLVDSFTVAESGTYYLDVHGVGSGAAYFIQTRTHHDDYADSEGSSYTSGPDANAPVGDLVIDGVVEGQIEAPLDSDIFSLDLSYYQLVHVTLTLDRPMNGTLDLVVGASSGQGVLLSYEQSVVHGVAEAWYFMSTNGTLSATVLSGNVGYTGGYTLETEVNPDDYGATPETAGYLGADGVVQSWIETNDDVDMFSLDVRAGQVVQFECDAQALFGYGMQYPELKIYDAGGELLLTIPSDYQTVNLALVQFDATGTYYVSVEAGGNLVPNRVPGTYTLSATTYFDDYGTDSIHTPNEVFGSPNSDDIMGTVWDDVIFGNFGYDTLRGWYGDDFLYGGLGGDDYEPGAGADTIYYRMGDGNDRIFGFDFTEDHIILEGNPYATFDEMLRYMQAFSSSANIGGINQPAVVLTLGNGDAITFVATTMDEITPEAFGYTNGPRNISQTTHGTVFFDYITGHDTGDAFWGHGGDDYYFAGGGGDWLFGGEGTDHLLGQDGDDHISGGTGSDKLIGGLGGDVFVVGHDSAQDTISDFAFFEDRIEFVHGSGVTDFSQVQLTQSGQDVLLEAGDVHVLLRNVVVESLNASMFVFDQLAGPNAGSEAFGQGDVSAAGGAVTLLDLLDFEPSSQGVPLDLPMHGFDDAWVSRDGPDWVLLDHLGDMGGYWA
ncbi:pre-peptidase C-terminal domain-containing protein [Hyphomonas jannaschiana]|uniref:pre-peptidase C-terminal domain-containing protein n=1 Tax=Hyphomonas jannaschiana TaxID=86 RepID=UPI0035C6C506